MLPHHSVKPAETLANTDTLPVKATVSHAENSLLKNVPSNNVHLKNIPLAVPFLDEQDAQAVADCVRSGWVSTYSPLVNRFEQAMAGFLHVPDTVALNCGTSALHLALRLAGVKPGDKVAVPALTFVATVNPVRYLGAIPVFVDACPSTFGMCPDHLSAVLAKQPDIKAVLVTHLYGHLANINAIKAVAGDRPLIEDAAEALGSCFANGLYAGTLAHFGCYSFNGNKTMTTGSGGLLVAKNPTLLATARQWSAQAKMPDTPEFDHTDVGYNYRMNGIQAALGLSQLEKLPGFLRRKRQIAEQYANALPAVTPPLALLQVPWLSTLQLRHMAQRDKLALELGKAGITTRPWFKPVPLLKPYAHYAGSSVFPVATALWEKGLCLPSGSQLSDEEQNYIIETLKTLI